MTDQNARAGQARTLVLQPVVNRIVRGVLRTPLLSQVAGKRLITLYLVGRKSGKRYTIPVAYAPYQGELVIGTPFAWGRNLRTGQQVGVRLLGKRGLADVRVLTDEAAVVEHYAVIARYNHHFAKFNQIGFDRNGEPRQEDLRLAWADGARAIRLTPR